MTPANQTTRPELNEDALVLIRSLQALERSLSEVERLNEIHGGLPGITVEECRSEYRRRLAECVTAIPAISRAFAAAMDVDAETSDDEIERKFRAWLQPVRAAGGAK